MSLHRFGESASLALGVTLSPTPIRLLPESSAALANFIEKRSEFNGVPENSSWVSAPPTSPRKQ
ncbi:hypothetical protein PtrCC142_011288, partial [Pyrenophora tritici-repentis]